MTPLSPFRRLRRSERGAALVEFALVLPLLIGLFAVIVEGGRVMWSYQTAISGVRDAARYLGRVVSSGVCGETESSSDIDDPSLHETLLDIVQNSETTDGSVMPQGVTVNSVNLSLECVEGTYRVSPAPVVTVTASVTINLPFAALLGLIGVDLDSLTTTITDRTRIFGA